MLQPHLELVRKRQICGNSAATYCIVPMEFVSIADLVRSGGLPCIAKKLITLSKKIVKVKYLHFL